MVTNIYSVRDVKTYFGDPFICPSDDAASRSFAMALANAHSPIAFSPEDFSLYKIGTFDTATGVIEKILPVYISCALDFVNKEK